MVDKVRENRVRRAVERQGYKLQKRRRIDPNAWDFGTYQIVEPSKNTLVHCDWRRGRGYGLSLDEVETWLEREAK